MRIRRNFASIEDFEAASNFRKPDVGAESGNGKEPNGYESEIMDRAEWTRKRERGQEGWKAMKNNEDRGANLFPHQIVDFTPASAPAQPVLSCNFPSLPTLLHICIR